jgi:hypothetical protein
MADLITFVLHEILKIPLNLISNYPTVQDKLIYLILIPHIILFIFIYFFAKTTIARILGSHSAIETALMFVVYLFLIYSGIYGSFFIPIFVSAFYILIFLGALFFILNLFIPPARHEGIRRFAIEAAKMVAQKSKAESDREAAIEAIDGKMREIRTLIASLRTKSAGASEEEKKEISKLIAQLEKELLELEMERRRLSK